MPEKEFTLEDLKTLINGVVDEKVLGVLSQTPHPIHGMKNITAPGEAHKEQDLLFEKEVPKGPSGFRGLVEFCYTVATNKGDKRLIPAAKGLEEGDPESAGNLVPIEYQETMLKLAIERGKIFPLCSMTPMRSAEEKFPVSMSLDESTGKMYGGIEFVWTDEGKAKSEKEFKLQRITLRSNTAAALCVSSNQLLEDSRPRADMVIRDLFTDSYKNMMDNIVVNGTGAGQPLGILHSPCLYTVAKESGQEAATIVWNNIKKMMTRMFPDGKDFCYWIINDECLEQIWDLNAVVGTGGSSVMVASGAGQDIKPRPQTLMSRPIIWCSHGSALGSKGDIILADLRQILIGIRKKMTIDVSIHRYFELNQALYRIESRLDGQPTCPSTMRTRTNFEVAPFVTLAART